MKLFPLLLFVLLALFYVSCESADNADRGLSAPTVEKPAAAEITSEPIRKIVESALLQTRTTTGYTQQYFVIPYPNGDVPESTGACTDVVIRAFRNAGVDLQEAVHKDMASNFGAYPRKWGLSKTDTNIDHRRVPNLQTFFERKGKSLPLTSVGENYRPGDVVSWDLDGNGMTHIGIVSNYWNAASKRYYIIHNIGGGARAEDRLFEWKITGHFRYF
jgi:uncharacterized protein YijF (DUF1287 family)